MADDTTPNQSPVVRLRSMRDHMAVLTAIVMRRHATRAALWGNRVRDLEHQAGATFWRGLTVGDVIQAR
jgi:hypothetical protein